MILFESQVDIFFRKFLNRGKKETIILLAITGLMTVINIVTWYTYFNGQLSKLNLNSITCEECFKDNSKLVREDLGKALTFPTVGLGMAAGYAYGQPSFLEYNENMLKLHWSLKGLSRAIIMLIMYAPMLIVIALKLEPNAIVAIATGIYFLVGVMITYLDLVLNFKLNIFIRGDIRLHHHIKQLPVGLPIPAPVPESQQAEDVRQD